MTSLPCQVTGDEMGLVTVSEQWLHGVLDDFMEAKHQTVIWTN